MRRTALYLGGLLLATGATLAMAGPAAAADNCPRNCNNNVDAVAVVRDVRPVPVVVFSDNDDCWYDRSSGLRVLSFDDDRYYLAGGGYRTYASHGYSGYGDFEDNNIINQDAHQNGFINTNLNLAGIFND